MHILVDMFGPIGRFLEFLNFEAETAFEFSREAFNGWEWHAWWEECSSHSPFSKGTRFVVRTSSGNLKVSIGRFRVLSRCPRRKNRCVAPLGKAVGP